MLSPVVYLLMFIWLLFHSLRCLTAWSVNNLHDCHRFFSLLWTGAAVIYHRCFQQATGEQTITQRLRDCWAKLRDSLLYSSTFFCTHTHTWTQNCKCTWNSYCQKKILLPHFITLEKYCLPLVLVEKNSYSGHLDWEIIVESWNKCRPNKARLMSPMANLRWRFHGVDTSAIAWIFLYGRCHFVAYFSACW